MEEKLVKVLLDQYKAKGIDMYALLDDPLFKNLDLNTKVNLIKKYASHISSGTSRTLTKKDIRAIVFDASFSGIATGISAGLAARQAGKYFTKGMLPVGAIAGAVALGAGIAAGASYLGNKKLMKQREEILGHIDATAKNPTDENALGVLIARSKQVSPLSTHLIHSSTARNLSTAGRVIPSTILSQVDPVVNYMSYKYNWNNQTNEYVPGVTQESYIKGHDKALEDMKKNYLDSLNNMKNTILGRN